MKKILNFVTIVVTIGVLAGLALWVATALFYVPIPVAGMESVEKAVVVKNDVSNISFISLMYVKLFIVFLAIIAVTKYRDTTSVLFKK